jgi:hypothetical protein
MRTWGGVVRRMSSRRTEAHMRTLLTLLAGLLCLLWQSNAIAQLEKTTYLGHLYTYEKAETYTSILGGKVYLLEPGGLDVMRDASWAILIEGEISRETTRNVKTLLDRVPGIRIVFLNSPGGDLFAGLDLGRYLSTVDVQAIVGAKEECASACALAFLAAKSRLILAEPGTYGFHRQYYIRNGEIQYGSWRKDVADIEAYLRAIGFTGVKADEIVGTTGLITYSDSRLSDRGIVTVTKRDHRKRSSPYSVSLVRQLQRSTQPLAYCWRSNSTAVRSFSPSAFQ